MLLTSIAALTLLAQDQVVTRRVAIPNQNIQVIVRENRLDPAKLSPKLFGDQRWEFDWLSLGYGNIGDAGSQALKLRVYSQERKQENDRAPMVARMVMQIWDRSFRTLKIDHPAEYNRGIVDFFLCFGGEPGGEQLFGQELLPSSPQAIKVNTVYIYQLQSFKNPIEMAREVAHEYGHAILPGIGGFKKPEPYANGYLGEKLFLKWIRDGMKTGKYESADAMGVTLDSLNAWVSANVDALIVKSATQFPAANLVNEASGGMDAFNGLALYVEALCPPSVFTRALAYTRDAHGGNTDMRPPTDFAQNVLTAAGEVENLALAVPPLLKDRKIWIPLGKGSVSGATVISRREGWAEVLPLMPSIVIKNPAIR